MTALTVDHLRSAPGAQLWHVPRTTTETYLLGLVVLGGCAHLVHSGGGFPFLWWNLFLAWVPLACHSLAARVRPGSPAWWAAAAAWLAFLPNAPYILTDFVHAIGLLDTEPLWLVLGAATWIAATAALGLLWFARSVHAWQGGLAWPRAGRTGFVLVICGLSAVGVLLGRILRFNSWDLLTHPVRLVAESLACMADTTHVSLAAVLAGLLFAVQAAYSSRVGRS